MSPETLEGRYRILKQIGQGGFGKTFLAEDLHMPSKRCCVIKRLKPIANEPATYQLVKDRFQREAALLEKLGDQHPQIPRLYSYSERENQFYLIQEWVDGNTLTEAFTQEGTWPSQKVKTLLLGILPILEFIHAQGLVHLDIKPDNIILRRGDRQPVLIDFGAVKETMVSGQSGQSLIVIGTPWFMPPEQCIGRPTFSSDLYSLGFTAIYLLTGKLPHEIPIDPMSGQTLWRQGYQPATAQDEHLATILDKAINTQLGQRFIKAQEMIIALQQIPAALKPTLEEWFPAIKP